LPRADPGEVDHARPQPLAIDFEIAHLILARIARAMSAVRQLPRARARRGDVERDRVLRIDQAEFGIEQPDQPGFARRRRMPRDSSGTGWCSTLVDASAAELPVGLRVARS
jgi:hypothetical protein